MRAKRTVGVTSIVAVVLVIAVIAIAGVATYFALSMRSPSGTSTSSSMPTSSVSTSQTSTTTVSESKTSSQTSFSSPSSQSTTSESATRLPGFPSFADLFGNFSEMTWMYSSGGEGNRTFSFNVVEKPVINGSLSYVVNISTPNGFSGIYIFNSSGVGVEAQTQFGNSSGDKAAGWADIAMNPLVALLNYSATYDPTNPKSPFNFTVTTQGTQSFGPLQMNVTAYQATGVPISYGGLNITSLTSKVGRPAGTSISLMVLLDLQSSKAVTYFELISAARAS